MFQRLHFLCRVSNKNFFMNWSIPGILLGWLINIYWFFQKFWAPSRLPKPHFLSRFNIKLYFVVSSIMRTITCPIFKLIWHLHGKLPKIEWKCIIKIEPFSMFGHILSVLRKWLHIPVILAGVIFAMFLCQMHRFDLTSVTPARWMKLGLKNCISVNEKNILRKWVTSYLLKAGRYIGHWILYANRFITHEIRRRYHTLIT